MTGGTVKAVAATGQLGTGFRKESFTTALKNADFVGCDAGSSDMGPYYLGSGESHASEQAMSRDLEIILEGALDKGIPAIIGSAGTAGGRPHLERVARVVRKIARQRAWHFSLALLDSEIESRTVVGALRAGRLKPLSPTVDLPTEADIEGAERFVAMLGPEGFQRALGKGAEVIIAGRSCDTSIFVALPMLRGIPPAIAYHAAKILECGAGAVTQRHYPDTLFAEMDSHGFVVDTPNPAMRCTAQSVAAHMLYENGDPFHLVEPSGVLDTSRASYTEVSRTAVRVTGSQFVGHRCVIFASVRDPIVIGQLDNYIARVQSVIESKVADSLGMLNDEYRIRWRAFGHGAAQREDGTPDPKRGDERGLLIDIIARNRSAAAAVAGIAWHTALHQPVPEYRGLVSNLAFPFSPPVMEGGPVYQFSTNCTWELTDPAESYTMSLERV